MTSKPGLSLQLGAPLLEAIKKALAATGFKPAAVLPAGAASKQGYTEASDGAMMKAKKKQNRLEPARPSADLAPDTVAASRSLAAAETPEPSSAVTAAGKAVKPSKKAMKHSGDDLGEDFDIEVDAAEDEGSKKKKKKKPLGDDTEPLPAGKARKGFSKKHKIVAF